MDKAQPPLWPYKDNEDALSKWLGGWLIRGEVPLSRMLTWAWFYGKAEGNSGWTRDKELAEWIEASKTHRHAWDGVQLLLRTLRQQNMTIPIALVPWALDIRRWYEQPADKEERP